MLAVSRRLITQHGNVTAGRWHGNQPPTVHQVREKVLGIVASAQSARRWRDSLQAFRHGRALRHQALVGSRGGCARRALPPVCCRILRGSDILSLHVPLNASTHHLIGAQELAVMKKSAIIVNTSRGPVIDEKAMTRRLSAGNLFRRGLDVFDEPTPPTTRC